MGRNLSPDPERVAQALALVQDLKEVRAAARQLGIPEQTLGRWVRLHRRGETGFQVEQPPSARQPTIELVARRKAQFRQLKRAEEQSRLINVQVKMHGPVGILHFGDPHVDDDGTDIEALERHAELVRTTPGLFGANVGDTTNNWVGRLARLYADQSTSAAEAWQLAEWFVESVEWLYLVDGNHDLFSGAGNPLRWIMGRQTGVHRASEVRLSLNFPNGAAVRINARHDFAGHSQWNPAHGVMKATTMGQRDHIAICGHKHVSGYGVLKDPASGITCHAIQVASYKVYDRYAKERGFRDQHISPCCVTVIDPTLPPTHPDLVKVIWDPEEGAEYLRWRRSRVVDK